MVTKFLYLRAIDKCASIYHRLHGGIDLAAQTFILLPQVYHLYLFLKHLIHSKNRAIPSLKRNSPLIIAFTLLFHLATRFHLFLRSDNGQLSIEILGGENHALGNNAFQLTGS